MGDFWVLWGRIWLRYGKTWSGQSFRQWGHWADSIDRWKHERTHFLGKLNFIKTYLWITIFSILIWLTQAPWRRGMLRRGTPFTADVISGGETRGAASFDTPCVHSLDDPFLRRLWFPIDNWSMKVGVQYVRGSRILPFKTLALDDPFVLARSDERIHLHWPNHCIANRWPNYYATLSEIHAVFFWGPNERG